MVYLLCDCVHTCGKSADRRSQFLANKQEHAITGRSVCDGIQALVGMMGSAAPLIRIDVQKHACDAHVDAL